MAKRSYDDYSELFLLKLFIAYIGTAVIGLSVKSCIAAKEEEKKEKEKNREFTIISVEEGDIFRQDDAVNENDTNTTLAKPEYRVINQTDKSITIFVYCENPADRMLYADYIETNININEDNIVYFNEEVISNEVYNDYIKFIQQEKNNSYQRKRE